MLLHSDLTAEASKHPHAVAVSTETASLTYAELDRQSNAIAHGLAAAGVTRGARVAILLDNRIEIVTVIYGVLKAGAAFMMVHPSTKAEKLDYLLRHSEAHTAIVPSSRLADLQMTFCGIESLHAVLTTEASAHGVPGKHHDTIADLVATMPSEPLALQAIDLDLAALLYTSGSTGEPKGVMLTHRNIRSAVTSIVAYLGVTERDVLMDVLPLSFSYGLTQLFSAVSVGARFVLERSLAFPHVVLSRMEATGVTGIGLVPSAIALLLNVDLDRYDLSRLRYITNAGAALPPPQVGRLRRALPHVDLFLMYGQTECMRISYLDPGEAAHRPDSVGKGMPNQDWWLVDENGAEVGSGETGELVIRGSHVMAGYWRQPEATAAALREGRLPGERVLHTRDLFRRDDDGFLYFVSRKDDVFKTRGMKVSSREVETVLYRLDSVLEAAVVPADDGVQGQVVKAVVVLKPGTQLSATAIKRHCAEHLEDYLVPTLVEFRESLPKGPSGKILTAAL